MRSPLASFMSLLVMRQGRRSEATEDAFAFWAKKLLHTEVRTGCHKLISLCPSVYNNRRLYRLRKLYGADFHKPESMESGECGLTLVTCFLACRLELHAVVGLL